jgi:hypothetical protein
MVMAHPIDSDLRRLPAFPVLVYNVLGQYLAAQTIGLGSDLAAYGDLGGLRFDGLAATGVSFALLPGRYELESQVLVANLASSSQTRLPTGVSNSQELGPSLGNQTSEAAGEALRWPWRCWRCWPRRGCAGAGACGQRCDQTCNPLGLGSICG